MGLILIEKLAATALFGVALGVLLVLYTRGINDPAQQLLGGELQEDPHDRLALFLVTHVPMVSTSALLGLALASLAYFVLEGLEAIGLLLERRWVEWLIVVETGLFLPFEVYELGRHATVLKVVTLLANVLILVYLVRRLQQQRQSPRKTRFSLT